MPDYTYKRFKIHYDIETSEVGKNLFEAGGCIVEDLNGIAPSPPINFHTSYPSRDGAEEQIKKIIEDYIDFEWGAFIGMREEH